MCNSPELHVGQVKSAATLKYIRFSGNLPHNTITCHQPNNVDLHHACTLESQQSTGDKRTAGQHQPSWCRHWHFETWHQPSLLVVFSEKVGNSQKPNYVIMAKLVQIRTPTKTGNWYARHYNQLRIRKVVNSKCRDQIHDSLLQSHQNINCSMQHSYR